MPAAWVVPALDVCEQCEARLRLGLPAPPIDEFALKGREEALGHCIVVGIADRTHRRLHANFSAAVAERDARVLTTPIAVMDDAVWLALLQRHVQRGQHQFGFHPLADRPANNTPAPHIQDNGLEDEAGPGRQWSKRRSVVELFPCLSSPNRTCTSQRIRLSVQVLLIAMATSA